MYVCKMYINDKWVGEGGWYNIRRAYNRTKNRAGFKRKKTNKSCRKVGGGGGERGAYKWKFTVFINFYRIPFITTFRADEFGYTATLRPIMEVKRTQDTVE